MKACIFCRHCVFDPGWGGSSVTPGEAATVQCRHNPEFDASLKNREYFLKWNRFAETCPKYKVAKDP